MSSQPDRASFAAQPKSGAPAHESPRLLEASLDLLACPACLQSFSINPAGFVCIGCGRIYPSQDGIPILLIDRAVLPL